MHLTVVLGIDVVVLPVMVTAAAGGAALPLQHELVAAHAKISTFCEMFLWTLNYVDFSNWSQSLFNHIKFL